MKLLVVIDPAGPVPIYRQVADAVRAAIAAGRLGPGEALPGVRELAAELRVNYHTVARAWQELADAGLVERQRGGPFVVVAGGRDAAASARLRDGLAALAREAVAQGIPADDLRAWLDAALADAAAPSPPAPPPAPLPARSDAPPDRGAR